MEQASIYEKEHAEARVRYALYLLQNFSSKAVGNEGAFIVSLPVRDMQIRPHEKQAHKFQLFDSTHSSVK